MGVSGSLCFLVFFFSSGSISPQTGERKKLTEKLFLLDTTSRQLCSREKALRPAMQHYYNYALLGALCVKTYQNHYRGHD